MKKLLVSLLALGFFAISNYGNAAEEKLIMQPAIGVTGGLNINMNSPSFTYPYTLNYNNLQVVNLSSNFGDNKTSMGFNAGLIGYIPINEMFTISPRVEYNSMYTTLKSDTKAAFTYLANPLSFPAHQELKAKLAYLEISPLLQIHNLISSLPRLYFLAGPEFGVPMTKKYDYTYEIPALSANKYAFKSDEKIPDSKFRIALALGAGYMFKLGERWNLAAEASYRIPFTKVSTNDAFDKWNISQLRVGLNLTYSFLKKTEKKEAAAPQHVSNINLSMGAVNSVTRDGTRAKMNSIRVEDMKYSELFPFIPYVFCDENAAAPTPAYQNTTVTNEAGSFNISTLAPDAIEINKSTLAIIGQRMNQYENAHLTITGTKDSKKEKSNKDLSLERANYAKNILVTSFGIDSNRIKTVGGGLPTKASSSRVEDGIVENRRIEFSSDEPALFAPIVISGENQRIAQPDIVEFLPLVETQDSIAAWKLDLYQSGRLIKTLRGTGDPQSIEWNISPNDLTDKEMPVSYTLDVQDNYNGEKTITGSIPVEYISISKKKSEELADKTISKYSLILFDFDKSDISAADMQTIVDQIVPAVKYNSTVDIYGYTDRIGDDKYNQKLALKRAEAVQQVLKSKVPDAKFNTHGVGESVKIFDNDSPLGRQLSRTVQIFISTPR